MTPPDPRNPPSLLIVDDHQTFRSVARLLLDDSFRVIGEANTGEEAVEMAARLRPDVILMDVHLPGIDGLEATRRITEHDTRAVVVLVSTHHRTTLSADLGGCGAAGFLRKDDLDVPALTAFVR